MTLLLSDVGVEGLPLWHDVVQFAGAGRQPAAAQGTLAPGTSRFAFSSCRKILRASPARRCAAVLLFSAPRTRAPPQPEPAVLRRAADGHLGALADGHKLTPCLAQVLAPEQPRLHVRGVEAPPLEPFACFGRVESILLWRVRV